jgi:N-methylhydantoinase A/oxoprolinase/acetone carboxylase beta subunit
MLIGIDVGGTYTDGVLFSEGAVVHIVKHPTDSGDLQKTLLSVLDELLAKSEGKRIRRIVLSTTLVTNLLASGRGERTALVLLPGSGLPFSSYSISPDTWFLKGSIDFRGREIEKPDEKEIANVLKEIDSKGIRRVAVAGKFSNRSDLHECLVKKIIRKDYPRMEVCTSNETSGRLNFPRRAATCYYTAMTMTEWNSFADGIGKAINTRIPGCELHILKADGGTITLEASRMRPCETVFSGPAASTLGGTALAMNKLNSVVVDIGGTTSDISLLISGQPLYASKGATIGGQLTHIRSFAVNSIAMGGDSPVCGDSGELSIGQARLGPAACFGGETPTVTDAFNILLNLNIGDAAASRAKLDPVARQAGQPLEVFCRMAADRVIEALRKSIKDMFHQWEDEPAYKVWEVVHSRKFRLDQVIGIGAAAPAIVPMLAGELGVNHFLHRYSPVANALGAALARPTLAVQVHVDTQNRVYTVSPGGASGKVENRNYQMEDARELALRHLKEMGSRRGLAEYAGEAEVFLEEQFNVIRGWDRAGKLFDVGIEIKPGFVHGYKGVE